MKACTRCKVEKPLNEYYHDKRSKNGIRTDCKSCVLAKAKVNYQNKRQEKLAIQAKYYKTHAEVYKEYSKKWRASNPDKTRQYHQEYAQVNFEQERIRHREKAHKRRAEIKGNGVFKVLPKEMKRLISTPCANCGSLDNITIDHVLPIARGGRHSIGNLQSLCGSCNFSKGKKTMTEWSKYKELIGVG